MQSARLKNIIILILVLVNLFLLASVANRYHARQETQEQVRDQLVSLFAADGVSLAPQTVSFQDPPAGGSLTRDVAQDRAMAAALLGENLSYSDQGGGIYAYESNRGAAMFRSNGSFDATVLFSDPNDAATLCSSICDSFGYREHAADNVSQSEFVGGAVRRFNGYPVRNCVLSYHLSNGILSVSGTFLPEDTFSAGSAVEPLSASAALTAFLNARRESGAVVSAVEEMYPCYELQSIAGSMTLVPAWGIVTDNGMYYVNCNTGAVTRD